MTTMKQEKGARDNGMLKKMTSAKSCWSKRQKRSKRGWILLLETIELHIVQWTLENICTSVGGAERWRRRGERGKSWRATRGMMNGVSVFR